MSGPVALFVLLAAALLEAGGDAIVRGGLHASGAALKTGLIVLGGVVLLAYGRLLGVYVSLFFVAAQAINFLAFGVAPAAPIVLGGALIVSGGLLMTVWR